MEITSPLPGPEPALQPEPAPEQPKEFTRADLAPAVEMAPPADAPSVDQGATPPAPMPAMEAPVPESSEAPAAPPEEAPAPEAPKKSALPSRKTGTRPLPGKRSTLGKRGLPGKDGEEAPKKSSKMLWIVVFLVVLAGGGAGLFFSGLIPMGGGGGPSTPEAATNPVDSLFKAAQAKDVDGFCKLVKGLPEKYGAEYKTALDGLDQYELTYKITKTANSITTVEWSLKYKSKPSTEPGGDTDPKVQEVPSSTDEVTFEADGVTYENLPAGFPLPKKLMGK